MPRASGEVDRQLQRQPRVAEQVDRGRDPFVELPAQPDQRAGREAGDIERHLVLVLAPLAVHQAGRPLEEQWRCIGQTRAAVPDVGVGTRLAEGIAKQHGTSEPVVVDLALEPDRPDVRVLLAGSKVRRVRNEGRAPMPGALPRLNVERA